MELYPQHKFDKLLETKNYSKTYIFRNFSLRSMWTIKRRLQATHISHQNILNNSRIFHICQMKENVFLIDILDQKPEVVITVEKLQFSSKLLILIESLRQRLLDEHISIGNWLGSGDYSPRLRDPLKRDHLGNVVGLGVVRHGDHVEVGPYLVDRLSVNWRVVHISLVVHLALGRVGNGGVHRPDLLRIVEHFAL